MCFKYNLLIFILLKIAGTKVLPEAESRMAEMQNYKKRKRKAAKQTEIENLEAQHSVKKAIKMKIEITSVKGQMEESFLRFPHIGEQILEHLDVRSLLACHKASKPWADFVGETKALLIELLQNVAQISKAKLKKSLKKHSVKTVKKLVICAIIERKRICVNNMIPRNMQAKLIHHMVVQKHLNNIQILLVELVLENVKNKNFITHYDDLPFVADFIRHYSIRTSITVNLKDVLKDMPGGETLIGISNHDICHDISRLLISSIQSMLDLHKENIRAKTLRDHSNVK